MAETISNEDILEAISNKSVMDVVNLIEAMEEKFGVSAAAAAPMAMPASGAEGGAQTEEQTEFDVVLTGFGENKVSVIKVVRSITSLGLKEAKELVEGTPSNLKEGVSKEDADAIKKQIEEAGGSVEVK